MKNIFLLLTMALSGCNVDPKITAVIYSTHLVVCDVRKGEAWYDGVATKMKKRAPEYDYMCACAAVKGQTK